MAQREIEFRGYDLDTERWYYGSYVALKETMLAAWGYTVEDVEDNVKHYIFFTQDNDWNMATRKLRATVDPYSVGQYTGMRDKNGKKIYEGDVISYDEHYSGDTRNKAWQLPVVFEEGAFDLEHDDIHWPENLCFLTLNNYCEVIGNTYEKETSEKVS